MLPCDWELTWRERVSFVPTVVINTTSLESDPRSYCVVTTVFCLPFPPYLFGFFSGYKFQQWSSTWPSFLQWVKEGFYSSYFFIYTILFSFPFPFPFSFPFEGLKSGFFQWLYLSFLPLFSRWMAFTLAKSILVGFKHQQWMSNVTM